jgi:hypothetical protein
MSLPETVQIQRFDQEWVNLQNQYEHYERGSLTIKLVCLVMFSFFMMFSLNLFTVAVIIAIFWLQEGIFRTYQARLGARLIAVEACLRDLQTGTSETTQAYQLHSEWQQSRLSTLGLILEYAKNATRPTVAFPYVVLLLLYLLTC